MNQWFTEKLEIVPGIRHQIKIKKILHSEKSRFQSIDIVETSNFGKMLILNNVIMLTEYDEYCYHEMMVHVPLFAHPQPQKILVIGGGDGGSIREILKHPGIKEVHLVEIDRRVVELSRQYLPSLSEKLSDQRVKIFFEDGKKWVLNNSRHYDLIIVDSSDPIGFARVLYEYDFFEKCYNTLTSEGIMVHQAEHFLLHGEIIKKLISFGRNLFPIYRYYFTQVPTYPGGSIGFTFFSKTYDPFELLNTKLVDDKYKSVLSSLRYWTAEIHKSAFTLPGSVEKEIFNSSD